jgi:hypothetical protein
MMGNSRDNFEWVSHGTVNVNGIIQAVRGLQSLSGVPRVQEQVGREF